MQTIKNTLTKRDRGFTLIELLVVIAIIAVLAALILAALSSAQKGSRDARRKSDLNQYKTALAQYNADQNTYPVAAVGTVTVGTAPACGANLAALTPNYLSKCLVDSNGQNYYYIGTATAFGVCADEERKAGTRFEVGPTISQETSGAASACAALS